MRFLLIDDHQLFVDGLEYVLNRLPEKPEISRAHTAIQALDWLNHNHYCDLVLLDINMPDMDGLSFLSMLEDQKIIAPVAILSASEDINLIQQTLAAGALGFISKSADSNELLKGIEMILQGEQCLPPWYKPASKSQINQKNKQDPVRGSGITPRQLQVLKLMSEGHSNKQIAAFLNLTEATVKSHISSLFKSLQTKNRTECINTAQRRGILENSNNKHGYADK